MMLRFAVATAVVAAVVVAVPAVGRAFDACMRAAARVGRSRAASFALIGFLSLASCAGPAIVWGLPLPNVHDEFAYLLAGETFARGRLTNQPHELGEFFQTFHVLQSPTYMAKFPVGQGMALAAGIVLGHPIIGVWLSMVLASVATYWMLRAALPPRWALVGGAIAATHPLCVWWGTSYWGGGVAMLGGAVFGGAAMRAAKAPRPAWGLLIGAGLAILANSRPLEGLIVSTILGAWLTRRAVRSHQIRLHLLRTLLPSVLILAPTFAFIAYDNFRVTGDPLTLPYALHHRQYMVAPLFYYQRPEDPPPAYAHADLRDFHTRVEMDEYRKQLGPIDHEPSLAGMPGKWKLCAENFVNPPTLYVPLVAAVVLAARARPVTLALAACLLLVVIHTLVTPWLRPHYLAPALGWFVLLATIGLRELSRLKSGGLPIARTVFVAQLVGSAMWMPHLAKDLARPPDALQRESILARLRVEPGKHLVLVRYGPRHDPLVERVVNEPDIDASRIVFARSRDDAGDARIIGYFADRRTWVLLDDGTRVELRPFPGNL